MERVLIIKSNRNARGVVKYFQSTLCAITLFFFPHTVLSKQVRLFLVKAEKDCIRYRWLRQTPSLLSFIQTL